MDRETVVHRPVVLGACRLGHDGGQRHSRPWSARRSWAPGCVHGYRWRQPRHPSARRCAHGGSAAEAGGGYACAPHVVARVLLGHGPRLSPVAPTTRASNAGHNAQAVHSWMRYQSCVGRDEALSPGGGLGVSLVMTSCQTVQTTRGGVVGVDRPQQMSVFTGWKTGHATARQQYLQVLHRGCARRPQSRSDADCARAACC